MQLVKYEWEKVQHAFLVTQYQVHGHASFAVMHANRSACTDKLTGELQLCLYIYIERELSASYEFSRRFGSCNNTRQELQQYLKMLEATEIIYVLY
jgi:hypothetical protein